MTSTPVGRLDGRPGPPSPRHEVFRAPVISAPGAPATIPTAVPAASSRRRSLAGYLLVPRPKDLSKAVLLPTTFGIGLLATGGAEPRSLLRAAIVLVAVELLIYAARYQWNDVRGFVADQRHPAEADRGRLPGPLDQGRRNVLASCAVAVARLLLIPVLALALPGLDLWPVLGWAVLGVFGVAVAYEALRTVGTGRTDQTPPPVRPVLVLIWLTVGAGYAVRGLIGLSLAVDLSQRPVLGLVTAVTLWSGGVVFVTTRWAVESTAFGRVRRGEIEWTAKAGHAREHLLALARWFPTTVRTVSSTAPGGAPLTSWEPLRERTPLTAPWHIALVIGGAAAGATGALLAAPGEWAGALATAAVGAALALALAARPGQRAVILLVGSLLIGAVLVGPGAALLDTRHALDLRHAVVAALPWLVLAGAYTRFVGRALQPAQNQPAPLRRAASRALEAPGRLLFGGPTWELLSGGGRS